jgi:hypothetical protein
MIKRTFGDIKAEIASVAGSAGLAVDDPRLLSLVNLAQERLCTAGEWPFQYCRIKFCAYGGLVSLPTEYEAIAHSTVDRAPVEVMAPWYEFLESGPGPQDQRRWVNVGIDRGESPVYRQPGPAGAVLRVVSTSGDDEGAVKLFGYDADGVRLTETLTLPEATTSAKFSKITQVLKPVTVGDVVLSGTDEWGEQYQLAVYRSRDTHPSFRTYHFTALGDHQSAVIHAIVRRRVFPVLADTDELLITNLGALRLGVKAIALEDRGDLAGSATALQLAIQILHNEARLYHAGRAVPAVAVSSVASLSTRPDIF